MADDEHPPSKMEAAFAKALPAMRALREEELETVNVNAMVVVSRVLGSLPRLRSFRDHIARDLPNHPAELLDELETYGYATMHAYLGKSSHLGRVDATPMVEEGTVLKKRLLTAAGTLADFGLLNPAVVQAVRAGQGHLDLATDLIQLAAHFDRLWATIVNKTPVTREEVTRASEVGTELLMVESRKERKDRPTREATERLGLSMPPPIAPREPDLTTPRGPHLRRTAPFV